MGTYDVAVIGAGPAGAVAAGLCARSGLKTVLLEKKRLPRVKTCGGGVTGKAMAQLRKIDCFRDESVERLISGLMIHLPENGASYELVSGTPFMGTVNRADFDMGLVEIAAKAGAEVRQEEGFIRYRRIKPYLLEIKTDTSSFKASILIGADGFHSLVRRQMQQEAGEGDETRPMMLGVACDIPISASGRLSCDHCHLFFNIMKNISYGWAFPKRDLFNTGLVIYTGGGARGAASANPMQLLKTFIKNITAKDIDWQSVGGAPIPLFDAAKPPVVQSKNVLLAGDAAGFVDAWTGEGIYYSIRSAVLAHRVTHAALVDQKGFDFLSNYAKLCKKSFYPELKMSVRASDFFKKVPSAYYLLRYQKVRGLFLPHTAGEIGYREAFSKAFAYSIGYKASILKDRP